MLTSTLKGKIARATAGIAAAGLVVGTSLIGGSPAGADPKQFSAFTGFGSDTTQDVVNALAGFNNNINYIPVQSSIASGKKQIVSWDAIGSALHHAQGRRHRRSCGPTVPPTAGGP